MSLTGLTSWLEGQKKRTKDQKLLSVSNNLTCLLATDYIRNVNGCDFNANSDWTSYTSTVYRFPDMTHRAEKPNRLRSLYVIPSYTSVAVNRRDVCWNIIFYSSEYILLQQHETRIYVADFVISQALTNLSYCGEFVNRNKLSGMRYGYYLDVVFN
jgi:hypothetical protein